MKSRKKIKKLKGDASHRIFYRDKRKKSSSIIVYAKKNKKLNLLIYDAINQILINNKILAPKLYRENYSKNYIEIQDFGDQTILSLLKKKKTNRIFIFKKILKLLNKIQSIRQRKIENFKRKNYEIPTYNSKILLKEAKLFVDWYASDKLKEDKLRVFKKKFKKITSNLIEKLCLKNNFFVHRDFHVSNLMMVKKKIGIIDNQDALIGNRAYDLASLIDDVRFKTSERTKNKVYNLYLKSQKRLNKKHFENDFKIISVLRNLKIIGIFTRLALRDNKKKYLSFIPYAWKLIELRSLTDKKFEDLNDLLSIFKKNY